MGYETQKACSGYAYARETITDVLERFNMRANTLRFPEDADFSSDPYFSLANRFSMSLLGTSPRKLIRLQARFEQEAFRIFSIPKTPSEVSNLSPEQLRTLQMKQNFLTLLEETFLITREINQGNSTHKKLSAKATLEPVPLHRHR